MSRSQAKEYPLEFFKGIKKALQGQITVEVDGQKQTFPVNRAEVRENDIVLDCVVCDVGVVIFDESDVVVVGIVVVDIV